MCLYGDVYFLFYFKKKNYSLLLSTISSCWLVEDTVRCIGHVAMRLS